jgi:Family of unknown function (DUF6113)
VPRRDLHFAGRIVLTVALIPLGFGAAVVGVLIHSATVQVLGVDLPVGLVVALGLELLVVRFGALLIRSRWGSGVAALSWGVGVLLLLPQRPEGDLLVTGTALGWAFLGIGTVIAGVVPALGSPTLSLLVGRQPDERTAGDPFLRG